MARLEKLKGGDLGAGQDPGQAPESGMLDVKGAYSGSLDGDLKSSIAVAQSEEAINGLKNLIDMFQMSTNAADPRVVCAAMFAPLGGSGADLFFTGNS